MAKNLRLRVVTPQKILFDGDVSMVIMRAESGDIGVLPGHEALTTVLSYGAMRVFNDEEVTLYTVMGGFAEIGPDMVTILSDAAERNDEIDRERAIAAKERALRDIENLTDKREIQMSQNSLRRALVRIDVSSYPIVGSRKNS